MVYAIAVVLVLIADQAMKLWTTVNVAPNAVGDACVELIPGFIHLTNVHNYGAAFSILQNARWPLVIITAVVVIVIIVLINREIIHTQFGCWTAVLVLGGAIGNCIDRILYGFVVDMFEFEFFSFPVFNVADIFITVCGILFCIHLIVHNEPEAVRAANEPEFVRRRLEKEAKAKEDPYAKIPHRGEHKTLEEELGAYNPDDPFGEWEFGKVIPMPAKAEPESGTEAATDTRTPQEPASSTASPFAEKDDLFASFLYDIPDEEPPAPEPELPAGEQEDATFPPVAPEVVSAPSVEAFDIPEEVFELPEEVPAVPSPAPGADSATSDWPEDDSPTYTLEDILNEFGRF